MLLFLKTENLDPYDQSVSCRISAKSLIPYVHLDIEESNYLTSGHRKSAITLPPHVIVLEFNVLGSGCYKKYVFCFSDILYQVLLNEQVKIT